MKVCKDTRWCFGQHKLVDRVVCTVLTDTYPPGACPFYKPEKDMTKGKRYPFNPDYVPGGLNEVEI